ncbi:DUF6153 family protein [Streptomyces roseolilacinus]|nr:DUF6153 family protein [Streptomyces roseolilacinus]
MTGGIPSRRRPAGRLLTLLVTAVLAGVLGMHGLGPDGAATPRPETGHGTAAAHSPGVPQASGPCSHTDGGSGHPAHADGTCAAAGTASAYAPPALPGALPGAPSPSAAVAEAMAAAGSGRAPPDLSELQILRI